MKTRVYQSLLLALCLSFLLFSSNLLAGTRVDPHGKAGKCQYCHTSKVLESAEGGFHKSSIEAACLECHGKKGQNLKEYLQRMLPDVKIKSRLVDYFGDHPDFSCHSCHNAMSPTKSSRKDLIRRNPHIQLNQDGEIIEKACLFCHSELPDYKNPGIHNVKMRHNVSYLCSLCHAMSSNKGGLGYGKRMTAAMIQKKRKFEKEYDVSLPLGSNNTVVCASCHNPHQPGIILSKGGEDVAGEHRLVLDDIWMMCTACHLGNYQK
jgi:hypothetical protein